jgi:KipI family sensor histidine kinase inhibitor
VRSIRRSLRSESPGDIRPFGDAALVFGARSADVAGALGMAVRSAGIDGVTDVVAGLDSVLVAYDLGVVDFDALVGRVGSITARRSSPSNPKVVVLPTSFDGPDLDEVGRLSGLGSAGVRLALLGATLRVSVVGFTPGFAYLSGLPKRLRDVPRRASPRPSVPAGSVALAGGHAAVYPHSTPGGWNLLGRTDAVLFDPANPPYAVLEPGDLVRFREVEPGELALPQVDPPRADWRSPRSVLVVESAGLLTTVQDRGRRGMAHLGVPAAGAADPVSFALANALVGNEPDAACLEATATGPTLLCRRAIYVAVVGAGAEVSLDDKTVEVGRVIPVAPGQRLAIGATGRGLRAYVAVRGGFDTPSVLGSRSTDRLVGLGPGPVVAGDELGAGDPAGNMADHLQAGAPGQELSGGPWRFRVLPFGVKGVTDGRSGLFERLFEVDPASDRVGLRLRPQNGAPLAPPFGETRSAGTTIGTVQVLPDGGPVVLMADHATLGGYPVGAVVIAADLGVLGRCRPGDAVELVAVTPEEAADALRSLHRALDDAVAGHYPVAAG